MSAKRYERLQCDDVEPPMSSRQRPGWAHPRQVTNSCGVVGVTDMIASPLSLTEARLHGPLLLLCVEVV
jgi:hypothetical protein